MWIGVPAVVISLLVAIALASRRHTGALAVETVDDNPNGFYLIKTGKEFSVRYTYDPHAADLWMFRTAEGHLAGSNSE